MGANKELLIKLLNNFIEWIFIANLSGGGGGGGAHPPPPPHVKKWRSSSPPAPPGSLPLYPLPKDNALSWLLDYERILSKKLKLPLPKDWLLWLCYAKRNLDSRGIPHLSEPWKLLGGGQQRCALTIEKGRVSYS